MTAAVQRQHSPPVEGDGRAASPSDHPFAYGAETVTDDGGAGVGSVVPERRQALGDEHERDDNNKTHVTSRVRS
jgi:hypothetical protein